jgi:dolichyl-phosphate beta-glucosyltransferase
VRARKKTSLLTPPQPSTPTSNLQPTHTQIPCPSILAGPPTVSLSVVIPAYNEEARLPATLDEALAYLQRRAQQRGGMGGGGTAGGGGAGGGAGGGGATTSPPPSFTWEVIVVDDGSRDATARVALDYARRAAAASGGGGCVRVLRLPRNRGKGMAVREGALSSRGALVLFADADGATRFSDVELLERALDESCASSFGARPGSAAGAVRAAMATAAAAAVAGGGAKGAAAAAAAAAGPAPWTLPADPRGPVGAALGSRAHLQARAVAQRTPLRNALMHGFHLLVRLAAGEGVVAPPAAAGRSAGEGGGRGAASCSTTKGAVSCSSAHPRQHPHHRQGGGIQDTQCGFKLATRRAAAMLFSNQRLQRWCFDVELALLSSRLGVPLREVGVCWTEMPGSKIRVTSVVHMAWELCVLRLAYGVLPALGLGGWRVHGEADERGGGGGRRWGTVAANGGKED